MTIIEADGGTTKPWTSDHLQIATGQRFSTLFQAKSAEEIKSLGKTSFWVQYENRERPANVSGYALVVYDLDNSPPSPLPTSLPATKPLDLPQKVYDWAEYALEPYDANADPFPTLKDVTRTVYITVDQLHHGYYNWAQNGDIWTEMRVDSPYLVDIYKNGQSSVPNYDAALANNGWDPKTLAYPAKIGEVLDIVWLNNDGVSKSYDVHPFHAHGGHYYDLGSGNGTYNAAENEKHFENYTPSKRDTTMLYRYTDDSSAANLTAGWRAWRLKVEYPGAWMMHCHILAHMIMGMQTAWVFGDANDIKTIPEPYVAGYLSYGGSAYGNATYDPLVNHHFPQ